MWLLQDPCLLSWGIMDMRLEKDFFITHYSLKEKRPYFPISIAVTVIPKVSEKVHE